MDSKEVIVYFSVQLLFNNFSVSLGDETFHSVVFFSLIREKNDNYHPCSSMSSDTFENPSSACPISRDDSILRCNLSGQNELFGKECKWQDNILAFRPRTEYHHQSSCSRLFNIYRPKRIFAYLAKIIITWYFECIVGNHFSDRNAWFIGCILNYNLVISHCEIYLNRTYWYLYNIVFVKYCIIVRLCVFTISNTLFPNIIMVML